MRASLRPVTPAYIQADTPIFCLQRSADAPSSHPTLTALLFAEADLDVGDGLSTDGAR